MGVGVDRSQGYGFTISVSQWGSLGDGATGRPRAGVWCVCLASWCGNKPHAHWWLPSIARTPPLGWNLGPTTTPSLSFPWQPFGMGTEKSRRPAVASSPRWYMIPGWIEPCFPAWRMQAALGLGWVGGRSFHMRRQDCFTVLASDSRSSCKGPFKKLYEGIELERIIVVPLVLQRHI